MSLSFARSATGRGSGLLKYSMFPKVIFHRQQRGIGMIQDISPNRFNNKYKAHNILNEESYIFSYKGKSLLLKMKGSDLELPRKSDFAEFPDTMHVTFLFSLNDVSCFLINDPLKQPGTSFIYRDLDFFRTTAQREIAWVSMAGFHLNNWYLKNRFCGTCFVTRDVRRQSPLPGCRLILTSSLQRSGYRGR